MEAAYSKGIMQRQRAEEREWSLQINYPDLKDLQAQLHYSLLTFSSLYSHCCVDDCLATKLWESSTVEASKSEWNETWANQNHAPQAKRDHLIWEHHGQEDEYVRLSLWGQIPNRWRTLMWKQEHLGREDNTYFCFTYAIWALLFVSFIINVVMCMYT